jgi:hypothetical protein
MIPDPAESISEFVLTSFKKILVTHDGGNESNKAIKYTIYLSNLLGAEIMILHIIEDNSELEGTLADISSKPQQPSSPLSVRRFK